MNGVKRKYIAYIMIFTIIIYAIVRYFNVVEGYVKNITKALMPFVVGAIMAYIINILMDAYEDLLLKKFHNKKIIRMVSILNIFKILFICSLLLISTINRFKSLGLVYIIENDIFTSCGIIIPRSSTITSIKVNIDKTIDTILIIFLL